LSINELFELYRSQLEIHISEQNTVLLNTVEKLDVRGITVCGIWLLMFRAPKHVSSPETFHILCIIIMPNSDAIPQKQVKKCVSPTNSKDAYNTVCISSLQEYPLAGEKPFFNLFHPVSKQNALCIRWRGFDALFYV
jgi:hypothetical protein